MRQILQNLRNGKTSLVEIPCPSLSKGHILIRTSCSLVSAGTERMLVEFGKASLIEKARKQPDKVKMVLEKIKTDGLMATFDAVNNKLNQPLALGYCNVGRVVAVAPDVKDFAVGDRVTSNGSHAEMVAVPTNLVAKIPENVSDEIASFTVLGSIGLQGIRLAAPTLGESFVVIGLGLIGLITVQLLKAHGCRVLGLDFDEHKLSLAKSFGAEVFDLSKDGDPVQAALSFSRNYGVDGVLVTASTKSSEPMHQAALMCRKRARIVLVGVTGLELSRADFYEKELSFQVSCSYGPGRYEAEYEKKGFDYPIGFVRWTEQRNFEAMLDLMADERLNLSLLISHRFLIENAEKAYEIVGGAEPSLGVLLNYSKNEEISDDELRKQEIKILKSPAISPAKSAQVSVGFIGAGNYATGVLIPAFKDSGAYLHTIASNGGVSGAHAAGRFGFEATTTDIETILNNPSIDLVVIATRHETHAELVLKAIGAKKHVFVEKPLAMNFEEVDLIEKAISDPSYSSSLMVGFNRRFSPQVQKIHELIGGSSTPRSMVMMVNAGMIPKEHWTQDLSAGGGRILGEACHFVDLLRFLANSPIIAHKTSFLDVEMRDTATITLEFENGSTGTIHYFANGNKEVSKERLEIFQAGRILQLDNFRSLLGYGWKNFKKMNLWRQDKGQKACVAAFLDSIKKGEASPISHEQLLEVARITIEIANGSQIFEEQALGSVA